MNRRSLAIAILVVLLLAIPLVVTSTYHMRIVNLALVFGLLAVSLNIVLGYTGQVALGHSGFFGIGAYTAALITEGGSGLLFWPGFLAAGIVTGIAGLAIGIPALRLRGHYLALATLGFGEIMRHVFFNWREVTRGMDGISGIPAPSIGIVELQGEGSYFYLALAILALAVLFCWRLQASKYGRMLAAIRDAELAAGTSGVNVARLKIAAFFISAVLAGFSGSLYAHLIRFISPDAFTFFEVTAPVLSMVIIGGVGTLIGPVLGAVVLTFLPELLRVSDAYYQLIYGAGLAAMVIFLPMGLLGALHGRLFGLFRPRAPAVPASAGPPPEASAEAPDMVRAAALLSPKGGIGTGAVFEARGLTCRFGGLVAIDALDLQIQAGTVHALIGPNGSGKSTFINLATGIYQPTQGSIRFLGQEVAGARPWKVAAAGLARTFQNLRLFRSMTVRGNVLVAAVADRPAGWLETLLSLARSRAEEADLHARTEQALRLLGLWHLRDQLIRTLPHEQQRLVEIARAVAMRPRLLMLDEPAAGMNPVEVERLVTAIGRLRELGITILLIEHNVPLVMRLADRVTVLNFGRKIAEGEPDAVREEPEVVTAYLGQRLSDRLRQNNAA